jgi:hydrogenase 3 maturation protease
MGIGNVAFGDDGFGVRLAEKLVEAGVPNVVIAGNTPERFVGRVAEGNFDHLIFLDAVDFGGAPGSVVWLGADEMVARFPQLSTHKISLGLLARWAESNGSTKAWLLGVQPESLGRISRISSASSHPTLSNTPLQWGDQQTQDITNRFSGFDTATKTAEAVRSLVQTQITPLKWGVNDTLRSEPAHTCGLTGATPADRLTPTLQTTLDALDVLLREQLAAEENA